MFWHFKVPGYRSEEMLNIYEVHSFEHIFLSANIRELTYWFRQHRGDWHYTLLPLCTYTSQVDRDSLSVTRKWDSPLTILMLVFLELCRSWWNDWCDYVGNFLAVISYCADGAQSLWQTEKLKVHTRTIFMALKRNTMKQDRTFHILEFLNCSDKNATRVMETITDYRK